MAKLVKGDSSGRYKLMVMNFEMLYTQNHRAHLRVFRLFSRSMLKSKFLRFLDLL